MEYRSLGPTAGPPCPLPLGRRFAHASRAHVQEWAGKVSHQPQACLASLMAAVYGAVGPGFKDVALKP